MATKHPFRFYATLENTDALFAMYEKRNLQELTAYTRELLARHHASEALVSDITVAAIPSINWHPSIVGLERDLPITLNRLVISYGFTSAETAREFSDFVLAHRKVPLDASRTTYLDAGADPGSRVADHWCPGLAARGLFGGGSAPR